MTAQQQEAKIFYGLKPEDKPRYGDLVFLGDTGGESYFWPAYVCGQRAYYNRQTLIAPRALVRSVPRSRHYFRAVINAFILGQLSGIDAVIFEHEPDDPLLFGPVPGPTGTAWWHQIDVWYDREEDGMKIHVDETHAKTSRATVEFLHAALAHYAQAMKVEYTMFIEWPVGPIRAAELRAWRRAQPTSICALHGGAAKRACTFDIARNKTLGTPRSREEVRMWNSTTVWLVADDRQLVLDLAALYGGRCTLSRPDRRIDGSRLISAEERIPYAGELVVEFVLATLPSDMPVYPVVWLLERLPEMRKFTLFELTRLVDAIFGSVRRARARRTGPVSTRLRRLRISDRPLPLPTKSKPTRAQ